MTRLKKLNYDKKLTQIVTKLKNSHCVKLKNSNWDKTPNLQLGQNSKTLIVTKRKNSNCDQNQKLKLWQKSNPQIVTILKNSNGDKIIKKKFFFTKLINSNCDINLKKIVTKLKNSNFDKTPRWRCIYLLIHIS